MLSNEWILNNKISGIKLVFFSLRNYRGISLLNTGYKIYSKIIAKRLTAIAEVLLLEEQSGFRKGRSCMDCIFPYIYQTEIWHETALMYGSADSSSN